MLRLKEVLGEKGKSQVWLSEQLGITKSGMSNLVTGRSKPSMQRVYEIAEILDVSIYELLEPNKEPLTELNNTDGNNKSDTEQKSNEVIETLTNENKSLQAQIKSLESELNELRANRPNSNRNALELRFLSLEKKIDKQTKILLQLGYNEPEAANQSQPDYALIPPIIKPQKISNRLLKLLEGYDNEILSHYSASSKLDKGDTDKILKLTHYSNEELNKAFKLVLKSYPYFTSNNNFLDTLFDVTRANKELGE